MNQSEMRFDGSDYDQERDAPRLSSQFKRVFDLMQDGEWRALREIADLTGDPEASVSAQLRHMRKERFGSHVIEKKYIENGLYHYRLLVNKQEKHAQYSLMEGRHEQERVSRMANQILRHPGTLLVQTPDGRREEGGETSMV